VKKAKKYMLIMAVKKHPACTSGHPMHKNHKLKKTPCNKTTVSAYIKLVDLAILRLIMFIDLHA